MTEARKKELRRICTSGLDPVLHHHLMEMYWRREAQRLQDEARGRGTYISVDPEDDRPPFPLMVNGRNIRAGEGGDM